MKLTLLPLEPDNLIRLKCEGHVTSPHLSAEGDPLGALLGPHCSSRKVLLNMEQVRSIDTGGVCWLMSLDKKFRQDGGRLVLYSVPGVVLDVLNILRLVPLLPIAADEAAAREMASRPSPEPAGPRPARREGSPSDNAAWPHG
jgi:anti-anti-sigma factor